MANIHPIFIAESNEIILDGLTTILSLEPDLRIVGTARNDMELVEKSLSCSPEVFLLDYDLLFRNGSQLSKKMKIRASDAKIIMLTDHWEKSLIKRMMADGVMGCLRKTCDANELIFAINQVVNGKSYFSEFSIDDAGKNMV